MLRAPKRCWACKYLLTHSLNQENFSRISNTLLYSVLLYPLFGIYAAAALVKTEPTISPDYVVDVTAELPVKSLKSYLCGPLILIENYTQSDL